MDARIIYVGSGQSGGTQTTQALQLFKGSDRGTLLYVCLNWGGYENQECSPSARVGILQGTHKFDLNLTMQGATVNDSGLYTAKVEVINPDTGATAYIRKAFQVIVDGKCFRHVQRLPIFNMAYLLMLEPALEVSIAGTGSQVAGAQYSLTCTVVAGPGLTGNPIVVHWIDHVGNVLNNATKDKVFLEGPVMDETTVILALVFSPLLVEHEGNYTCMATVSSSELLSPVTISQTRNVDVQSKFKSTTDGIIRFGKPHGYYGKGVFFW